MKLFLTILLGLVLSVASNAQLLQNTSTGTQLGGSSVTGTAITNGFTPVASLAGGLITPSVLVTGVVPGTVTLNDASGNLRLVLGTNDNILGTNATTGNTFQLTNGAASLTGGLMVSNSVGGSVIITANGTNGTATLNSAGNWKVAALGTITEVNYGVRGNKTNGVYIPLDNAVAIANNGTNAATWQDGNQTNAGVIKAVKYYGDGSALTGVSGGGGSATNAISVVLTNGVTLASGVTNLNLTNFTVQATASGGTVTIDGTASSQPPHRFLSGSIASLGIATTAKYMPFGGGFTSTTEANASVTNYVAMILTNFHYCVGAAVAVSTNITVSIMTNGVSAGEVSNYTFPGSTFKPTIGSQSVIIPAGCSLSIKWLGNNATTFTSGFGWTAEGIPQ